MSAEKLAGAVMKNPIGLGIGVCLVIGLMYYLGRKTASDVAAGVGGVVSGNNELTKGTAYEGMGILGTLGAAFNTASGGTLEKFGYWLSDGISDLTHWGDPNVPSKINVLTAASDVDGAPSSIR